MASKTKQKGKKERKPTKSTKKWEFYKGGKVEKRVCPKCSAGVFMAEHKNRFHCGRCAFTEFKK